MLIAMAFHGIGRATEEIEECNAPLSTWLSWQILLIIVLQILPILAVPVLRDNLFKGHIKNGIAVSSLRHNTALLTCNGNAIYLIRFLP